MQLDLFAPTRTGFKYRRRLYNDNGNYMYTAIPIETGYRLIPISIGIKSNEIIELSHSEYETFVKAYVVEIPKDVEERE